MGRYNDYEDWKKPKLDKGKKEMEQKTSEEKPRGCGRCQKCLRRAAEALSAKRAAKARPVSRKGKNVGRRRSDEEWSDYENNNQKPANKKNVKKAPAKPTPPKIRTTPPKKFSGTSTVGSEVGNRRSREDYEDEGYSTMDRYSRTGTVGTVASVGNKNEIVAQKDQSPTLEDLQGIGKVKKRVLQAVTYPFLDPGKAGLLNVKPPKGVLLTGKSGTGKSVMAQAIINEIWNNGVKVSCYKKTAASLENQEDSERRLRELFAKAKRKAPSVIFVEDVDKLKKPETGSSILPTLLKEMNKLTPGKVLLIATASTTSSKVYSETGIGKESFDVTVRMPVPKRNARREILTWYFDKVQIKLGENEMDKLVNEMKGFTGREMKAKVKQLHLDAVWKLFPNGAYRNMTREEVLKKKKEIGRELGGLVKGEEEEVEEEVEESVQQDEEKEESVEEEEAVEDDEEEEEMEDDEEEEEMEEEEVAEEEEIEEEEIEEEEIEEEEDEEEEDEEEEDEEEEEEEETEDDWE